MAARKPKVGPRLTLETIEAVKDIREEAIDVPEWGGSVLIRGASKAVFDTWMNLPDTDWEDTAFLLSECVVEPKLTPEEALKLRAKSAAAVNRLVGAINKLSSAEGAERQFLAGDTE